MRAIIADEFGGPEVLRPGETQKPGLQPGEVLVKVRYAGVNFADTLFRANIVPSLPMSLPHIPGFEASGVVEKVGPGVEGLVSGDKALVSLLGRLPRLGCYAEYVAAPLDAVIRVPADIDLAEALCMTHAVYARQLLEATVRPGDSVLVSAAAGGVGAYCMQLAPRFGAAAVFGGVGSDEKRMLLEGRGFQAVNYGDPDWPRRLIDLTGGSGVTLVLSSITGDFLRQSQRALLAGGGRIVVFGGNGDSSEVVIDVRELSARRQSILSNPAQLDAASRLEAYEALFELLRKGGLRYIDRTVLPLDRAAEAHRRIGDRANVGKFLLEVAP